MLSRPALLAPIASLLALAGAALGQVQPEAKQKLQDMVDTFKKAQSLSFSVSLKNLGAMSMLAEMKGDVVLARGPGGEQLLHVEGFRGASELDKTSKEMTFVLASDGKTRAWIDHEKKLVIERPAASQGQEEQVNVTNLIIPREYLNPALFNDMLNAQTITLGEPLTTDGVACDIVQIKLGEARDEYSAAIGQSDHLIHKLSRTFAGGGGMAMVWFFKNVKADAPVSPDMWKIKTPEGYRVDAILTPPLPPPQPPTQQGTPISGSPTPPAAKMRAVGPNPDDLAPDFELKTPDGTTVHLADLRGNAVLLEFCGTWCAPCKSASAEVQKIADKYKTAPVKVYSLAVREPDDETPVNFLKERRLTIGLLLRADDVARKYHATKFPSFFVIGKEGEIAAIVNWNAMDAADTVGKITRAIDKILGGGAAPAVPANAPAKGDAPQVKPMDQLAPGGAK